MKSTVVILISTITADSLCGPEKRKIKAPHMYSHDGHPTLHDFWCYILSLSLLCCSAKSSSFMILFFLSYFLMLKWYNQDFVMYSNNNFNKQLQRRRRRRQRGHFHCQQWFDQICKKNIHSHAHTQPIRKMLGVDWKPWLKREGVARAHTNIKTSTRPMICSRTNLNCVKFTPHVHRFRF